MKLGLIVGYDGARFSVDMDLVLEAERVGFDSVWTSEAYGADAVTPAAWILARTTRIKVGTAIMQMAARTPTLTAMTAMTLHSLSGGRFMLGLGPSGPQVIEGWYGVAYGKALDRTREYIAIIRRILARAGPLVHEGAYYRIPYRGADASGLAKPLKSILHGDPTMAIYTAAITPGGLRLAAELADGVFPIWMNPERFDVFEGPFNQGFARAGAGKGLAGFAILPAVRIALGDDVDACRQPIKRELGLYIGGMGARAKNFYTDYARRLGYAAEADRIQDLFLGGRRAEAIAAVPDALVDETALVGPRARIVERLGAWKAAATRGEVDTMLLGGASIEAVRMMAEELL